MSKIKMPIWQAACGHNQVCSFVDVDKGDVERGIFPIPNKPPMPRLPRVILQLIDNVTLSFGGNNFGLHVIQITFPSDCKSVSSLL